MRTCFPLVGFLILTGCDSETKPEPKPAPAEASTPKATGPVLKIAVLRDGTVTANDVLTSVADLRPQLAKYKAENGAVWYYREGGAEKAPPVALEVLSAVLQAKMSIRLSSRPDYSDSIGPDGQAMGQ